MDPTEIVTTTEAVRLLACDRTALRYYVAHGKLSIFARPGPRSTLFLRKDVLALRAERLEATRARLAALEAVEVHP